MRTVRNFYLDKNAAAFPGLAGALATGHDVYIPFREDPYILPAHINLANGQRLYGIGPRPPKVQLTDDPRFLFASGVTGARLDFLDILGTHTGTSYTTLLVDCHDWRISDVRIFTGNSGWDVAGGSTNITFNGCSQFEMLGSSFKFRQASSDCAVRNCDTRNVANFGVVVEDGAHHIEVAGLRKFYSGADITPELAGHVVEGDRIGLEGVGVRFEAHHVTVRGCDIRDTDDNGISLSGDHCVVRNTRIDNCDHVGLRLYGTHNIAEAVHVTGSRMSGCQFGGNAGGYGRLSRITRCRFDNNGDDGIRFANHSYREWVSGGTFGSTVNYCLSIDGTTHRVYRAGSPTDTFGTSQPVHESGIVSDGVNDWEFVSKLVDANADARWNVVEQSTAEGNGGSDFVDLTTAANQNTVIP